MHRIDSSSATIDHKFTEGDPTVPVEATTVTADWLNAVQGELVTVIESAGLVLDKADNGQLLAALLTLGAGGRVQRTITLDAAIASGGTLYLPTACAYTVGAGGMILSYEGVVLGSKNYTEIGTVGSKSTNVKLLFAATAGSEITVALTAAGGGSMSVAIPTDLRDSLTAVIARATAAAAAAEAAAASVGDPLYVETGA